MQANKLSMNYSLHIKVTFPYILQLCVRIQMDYSIYFALTSNHISRYGIEMYSVEFRYKGHEKYLIKSHNLLYIKIRNKIISFYHPN